MSDWPECRWYVAWHPESDVAVLRAKNADGLAEWRGREWRDFPSTPEIVEVTADVRHRLGFALEWGDILARGDASELVSLFRQLPRPIWFVPGSGLFADPPQPQSGAIEVRGGTIEFLNDLGLALGYGPNLAPTMLGDFRSCWTADPGDHARRLEARLKRSGVWRDRVRFRAE